MMNAKAGRFTSMLLTSLLAMASPFAHAAFDIPQSVIAGGGGTSASGAFSITGTIGQSIVGASTGGSYAVNGGFWGGGASTGGGTLDIFLYVTVNGTGSGTVTSAPAGISCTVGTCFAQFTSVASVTLIAAAGGGSVFTGWLGACTGTAACVISTAGAQYVTATFAPNNAFAFSLDVDENGSYDALTDGLLVLRYLFGRTGTDLTQSALGFNAALTDPTAVKQHLDNLAPLLDIDGNGQLDAQTDGLLVLRYLFGLRDNALIAGIAGAGATRMTSVQIESYIQSLGPPP